MKVDPEIKSLEDTIRRIYKQIRWLKKHRSILESLARGSFCGNKLDFDNLPHVETIKLIRALGGKWKKSANTLAHADKTTINYVREVDGICVRVWAGDPPPSCRMVEVEEEVPERIIPAHKKKSFKMVCTGKSEPLAVALAMSQPANTRL